MHSSMYLWACASSLREGVSWKVVWGLRPEAFRCFRCGEEGTRRTYSSLRMRNRQKKIREAREISDVPETQSPELRRDPGCTSYWPTADIWGQIKLRRAAIFSTGVPQEFSKHVTRDYLARGTDLFSLRLSNKKMTTHNKTIAIQYEWIKIIPIFWSDQ